MDFCVSFCMVFIDSFRVLFTFTIVGSLSFKASNLVIFNSILKGATVFFLNTLRSNWDFL